MRSPPALRSTSWLPGTAYAWSSPTPTSRAVSASHPTASWYSPSAPLHAMSPVTKSAASFRAPSADCTGEVPPQRREHQLAIRIIAGTARADVEVGQVRPGEQDLRLLLHGGGGYP